MRWSDLGLERGQLSVRQSLSWTKEGPVFAPPKTKKSRRNVELTKSAIAALRRHRTRQLEERIAAGSAWRDGELVFADEIGGAMKPDRLRWTYSALLRAAGLARIRFYDLRHTFATIALGRGVHPKIVSEMLGHSTVAITLDLYSHVTPTMQRETAAIFDKVLGGAR